MLRVFAMSFIVVLTLVGCGARQMSDAEDGSAMLDDPEWSTCVVKGEFVTCEEVCVAQGQACVAAGCPANPMSCKPDACDMATSLLGLGPGICTDPYGPSYVAHACEDPIEFIFNDTARCCCEG